MITRGYQSFVSQVNSAAFRTPRLHLVVLVTEDPSVIGFCLQTFDLLIIRKQCYHVQQLSLPLFPE
jgi:hypothetical protein